MTGEDLRRLIKADPFEPFTIHTVTGRAYSIPHRDFVWIEPGRRSPTAVIVGLDGGGFELVNTMVIERVEFSSNGHSQQTNEN